MGLIIFFREHGGRLTLDLFRDWCDVRTDGGERVEVRSNKNLVLLQLLSFTNCKKACLLRLHKGFENKTYKEIQEEALESKRQDLAILEANGGIWPGVRTPSHELSSDPFLDVSPAMSGSCRTSSGGESGSPTGLGMGSKSHGRRPRAVMTSPPSFRHPPCRNVSIVREATDCALSCSSLSV
ncbi:hypothetical protein KSP39_PZI017136 [Platanthera zijinensis]|uniref:Uncharacterized protein n=1 Tax=Platanthera zijinensis TaxID=2320716 RepID=A0AAP0B6C8_9ASPA